MSPYVLFLYFLIFVIGVLGLVALVYSVIYLSNILLGYGVPNVTTNKRLHSLLLNNLSMDSTDSFVDLGCGEGVVVELVKKAFPDTHCLGYENGFTAYKKALVRREKSGLSYELSRKDFFGQDISDVTVIYTYLMPHLMKKVWKKISLECKKGTLLYCNAFPIPDLEPTARFSTLSETGKEKTIYLYTV